MGLHSADKIISSSSKHKVKGYVGIYPSNLKPVVNVALLPLGGRFVFFLQHSKILNDQRLTEVLPIYTRGQHHRTKNISSVSLVLIVLRVKQGRIRDEAS